MFKMIKENGSAVLGALALMWALQIINSLVVFFSPYDLARLGIHPRSIEIIEIPAIFLAPFIHADFSHLAANSIPFAVLFVILLAANRSHAAKIMLIIIITGGMGIWLFGAHDTVHVGMSGTIIGMIGFLITYGIYSKEVMSQAVSIIVFIVYGGAITLSLLPMPGISWTGHAFGFLGGVYAAKKLSNTLT